ncbi:MAG: radical SAM protein [Deltaproteobacteria bacterium]|nr:radical SAM protein [Deltaproteobacteria bacterium]
MSLPIVDDVTTPAAPSDARVHLYGMRAPELTALLVAAGVECTEAEARRVLGRVISEGNPELRTMKKPVRTSVRVALDELTRRDRLVVHERVTDDVDGFEKLLLRLDDGAFVECVKIPLLKPGCFTVCLSSQVGCAMGCVFCATGRLGLTRHLKAWEIVSQLVAVRDSLKPGERITGAVFMGQGEPLHNYDDVIAAARVLSDPTGGRIEARNISISTVGLVPQMHRYAREGHKFRLVVSLHSVVEAKRKSLLPIAKTWSLVDVAGAIRALHASSGDRVTIAFCLMSGVNTGDDEVAALQALLPDVPLRINLIDVNDARSIEEGGFTPPSSSELAAFLDALQALGQPVVRRYSGGKGKQAACGMLASTVQQR